MAENEKQDRENEIQRQIDSFVSAFENRDLELMMSLYAPTMVSFDIVPPLQDVGADKYRKVWQKTFAAFEDSVHIDIRDLKISSDSEIAFTHNLLRLQATSTSGQQVDFWERLTLCFQKIGDKWLIVHEHVSVPINFEKGRAVLDLQN